MPGSPARIVAVANQKGGVGKSTTAVSLGAALAELGKRVLVVDLDPQGNASTGLGIRHEAREVTVYDVLATDAEIEQAIVATPLDNLYAIPSTIDLAGAEIELVSQFSRELRLRKALEPLAEGPYDYILLDCPPSLGLLTVNALAAAQELIVPIQCEYYALEGLGQLLRNVRLVQQNVNPSLRLTGIVMTMYDPRTKLSEQVVEEVRRYFGDRVYDTIIPRTVRLSEAPGFGQPITVYDPRSRGAQCYRELAREVETKPPGEGPLPVIEDLPAMIVPPPEAEPTRAPRPLVPERGLEDADLPSADGLGQDLEASVGLDDDEASPEEVLAGEPLLDVEPTEPSASAGAPADAVGEGDRGGADAIDLGSSSGPARQEREDEAGASAPVTDRPSTVAPEHRNLEVQPVERAPRPGEATSAATRSEAAVEREAEPTSARESGLAEREPAPTRRVEVGRVIVIDDEVEAEPEPREARPQPEPMEAGRRRWNPFRRGGDR